MISLKLIGVLILVFMLGMVHGCILWQKILSTDCQPKERDIVNDGFTI